MSDVLIRDGWLGDRRCDLRVAGGRIAARAWRDEGAALEHQPGDEVLEGGRITPAFADPHLHLDAALLGERAPNRSGTLAEGIANWARLRDGLTAADVRDRALRTVDMYLAHGATRLRTHVDTGNLEAVQALVDLRAELAARGITLQVVAFPQQGILTAPGRHEAWEQAVRLGCDAVGAAPHLERTAEEGRASIRLAFDLAEQLDLQVDLHCDETDDPGSRHLEVVCAETLDRGFEGRVVAGHCTAMHSYPDAYAAKVIRWAVEADVQIVANPLDNAVLQGRHDGYPKRRGITRVDELWAAGASVGIGHDSVQDPWYRLGTANLLDAAWLLVHLGHLTGDDQMRRVFRTLHHDNHRAFGGPPALAPGERAELLWWEHEDPIAILRDRPRPRVFAGGIGSGGANESR